MSTPAVTPELLLKLAHAYGIDTEYTDAFGNVAHPPDETFIKILKVFGVTVRNDDDIDAALAAKQSTDFTQVLAPTYVVSLDDELTGEEVGIPVHLPVGCDGGAWQLTLENGSELQGHWAPEAQPPTDTHTINCKTYGQFWLHLDVPLPYGYHQFQLTVDGRTHTQAFIVTPKQCYQPTSNEPFWGLAIQLYAQQSQTNLGIGNFTDLATLTQFAQGQGASMVGINPIHSLFPSRPGHKSPYSPASRLFYNHLYIDPKSTSEWEQSSAAQQLLVEHSDTIAACRQSPMVAYDILSPLLLDTLRHLFETFQAKELNTKSQRAQDFHAFCAERGQALTDYATFMAISGYMDAKEGRTVCWWEWPISYQQAHSKDVAAFRAQYADEVHFYQYLQFLIHEQLTDIRKQSTDTGMAIGLYGDLAVGSDVSGADVWLNPDLYATNVRVGCPPDDCNRLGQDWGLPPMKPDAMMAQGLKPWAELLRANMRYYGALRIDHALAMLRLFWIPEGMNGTQGTYVRYPYYALLGVLALESHRNQCVVIGEDLGTIPPIIFESFPAWGVHSYRLLYFEREGDGSFIRPENYPPLAMATLSTHDLATLPGFWQSDDIEVRQQLGLYPTPEVYTNIANARPVEKTELIKALHSQGLWPTTEVPDRWTPELSEACYTYLAKTPSRLLMCQLEDLVGQISQVNLPGTVDEHPNWQRKISVALEELPNHGAAKAILATIASARPLQSASAATKTPVGAA